MMPVSPTYGAWPRSGEIDILESRGNDGGSYSDGSDTASSSLHWGLDSITDMYWQTTSKHYARRTDYTKDFHTFGLEWSENYLYTYIDNRLLQVVSVAFGSSGGDMWSRGGFEAQGLT
jgi:beta-glucanase (GH16 family)